MMAVPVAGIRRRILLLALGVLLGTLLGGPARAQDAATVAEAQAALEAARSARLVRAFAAPELAAAERALERALAAQDAGGARDEVEHLAYLAESRAAVAQMRAEERRTARALQELAATRTQVAQARALEAAAAERRTRGLVQGLRRFDVRSEAGGLLLTPRERWFDSEVMPARRAVAALTEAARLLGRLPERQVVVLGYALRGAPLPGAAEDTADGAQGSAAATPIPARYPKDGAASPVAGPDDLGCTRADVVRAFLISNGVDPRRVVATCLAPRGMLEAPAAGDIAIQILPENASARSPTMGEAIDAAPPAP
ncbi:MAG TPA: DUF4398 domain-containing protein [Geminicoccaceae bacterium]|nr:DUF4398 domain-containing protein [Geminicoccaceae bacterium]